MAKAKQTKTAEPTPAAAPAASPADISAKLSAMLNQSAAEARGDADVNADVPAPKVAGGKATWKGTMELPNGQGGVLARLAVSTCKAVDDEKFERNTFHSAECLNRLKQGKMTCCGCGAEVERNAGVKGVESDGQVYLISDEELKALVPQNDKTMKITEFVDAAEIDPIYFESAEFLYPQEEKNQTSQLTFALLSQALRRDGKVAKGVRVNRGKSQEFVVRPYGARGLSINMIRAAFEVRDASGLWADVAVPAEGVEMLATLIEGATVAFTPAKRDQFQANANKLLRNKKAGVATECPTPEPEAKGTDDLLAALKAAVAKAGK
jgi:DNA end-binding protein Ku